MIDCTNAFRCTFKDDPSKHIYCYLPPFYQHWYILSFPHDYCNPHDGHCVLQLAQLMQGSPHTAN